MAILEIRLVGDPVLRSRAKPVKHVTRSIKELLEDMANTMYESSGVGLAAPQVGVSKRLVVVDAGDGLISLINPEIVRREGSETGMEGCLSIPGIYGEVERASRVVVEGLGPDGRRKWVEGEGLLARVLQHEIDHLDGILFVDRAMRIFKEEELPAKTKPRILFMGTPSFALPSLRRLLDAGYEVVGVVTNPDRPSGRGMREKASPVKDFAVSRKLNVLQPETLKREEFIRGLREFKVDAIVVVAYGKILPETILDLPRLGCLNLHASLLPKYRGAAPIPRAIMNGESVTGVTIQYMTAELDAGDILLQKEVEIGPEETAGELGDRLAEVGADLVVEALRLLVRGEAPRIPQEGEPTYAPPISKEEALIDWGSSASRISNLVRALNPNPGAFTFMEGRRLKIWRGKPLSDEFTGLTGRGEEKVGTVLAVNSAGFVVKCGDGLFLATEVQPENRSKMSGDACVRGRYVKAGDVLGR